MMDGEQKQGVAFKARKNRSSKSGDGLPESKASASIISSSSSSSSSSLSSSSLQPRSFVDEEMDHFDERHKDTSTNPKNISSSSSLAISASTTVSKKSSNKNLARVTCFDEDEAAEFVSDATIGDKKSKASRLFKKVLQQKSDGIGFVDEPQEEAVPVQLGGRYSKESMDALRQINRPNPEMGRIRSSITMDINDNDGDNDNDNDNDGDGGDEYKFHRTDVVQTFELSGADAEKLEEAMDALEESEMLDREEYNATLPSQHLSNNAVESYIGRNRGAASIGINDEDKKSTTSIMSEHRVAAILSDKKNKGSAQDYVGFGLLNRPEHGRVYTDNLKSTLDDQSAKRSKQVDMYNSMSRSDSQESEDWEHIVMKRALAASSGGSTMPRSSTTSSSFSSSSSSKGRNVAHSRISLTSIADVKSLMINARDKIQSNITTSEARASQLQEHLNRYESEKGALVGKMDEFVGEFNTFKEIRRFFVDLISLLRSKSSMVESLLSTQTNLWRDFYFNPRSKKRIKDQTHLLISMTRSRLLHDVDSHFAPSGELKELIKAMSDANIGDSSGAGVKEDSSTQAVLECFKSQVSSFRKMFDAPVNVVLAGLPLISAPGGALQKPGLIDIEASYLRETMILPQRSAAFFAMFDRFSTRIYGNSSEFCQRLLFKSNGDGAAANLVSSEYLESNIDDIVGLIDLLEIEYMYDLETQKEGRSVCSNVIQAVNSKLSMIARATSIIFDDVDEELNLSPSILEQRSIRGAEAHDSSHSSRAGGSHDMDTNVDGALKMVKITNCSGLLTVANYLRRNHGDKYTSTFISEAMPDIIRTYIMLPLFSSSLWQAPLTIDSAGRIVLNFSKVNFKCNFDMVLDYSLIQQYMNYSTISSPAVGVKSPTAQDSTIAAYESKLDESLLPRVISKVWMPMVIALIEHSFDVTSIINSTQCRNYVLQAVLYCDKDFSSSSGGLVKVISTLLRRISMQLDAIVVPLALSSSGLASFSSSSSSSSSSSLSSGLSTEATNPLCCLPSLRPLVRIPLRRLCKALLNSFLVCDGVVQPSAFFKIIYQNVLVRRRNIWKIFCRESLDVRTADLFLVLLSLLCMSIPSPGLQAEITSFSSSSSSSSSSYVNADFNEKSNYALFACITDMHSTTSVENRNKIVASLLLLQNHVSSKIFKGHNNSISVPLCEEGTLDSIIICVKDILKLLP